MFRLRPGVPLQLLERGHAVSPALAYEDKNTTHWLENRGTRPAVEISVDIVRQQ